MSFAFQITEDDIVTVASRMELSVDEDQAAEILALLDLDAVEDAALAGTEMEEQVGYAYEEIERQLKEDETLKAILYS